MKTKGEKMSIISTVRPYIRPKYAILTATLLIAAAGASYATSLVTDKIDEYQGKAEIQRKLKMLEGRKQRTCDEIYGEIVTGTAKLKKEGCLEGYHTAVSKAKTVLNAW